MPGAYTHMLVATETAKTLKKEGCEYAATALKNYPQWLKAGSVAPDYPYMQFVISSHDKSDIWADRMHYGMTGDFARVGIKKLKEEFHAQKNKEEYQKKMSWLYGYVSHIIADVSIHPVVRAIVGEYRDNASEHRKCEMYMDSFIFNKVYGSELIDSNWGKTLHKLDDKNKRLCLEVKVLWEHMLQTTYPKPYKKDFDDNFNPLMDRLVDKWHQEYVKKISLAGSNKTFISRDWGGDKGILYVKSGDIPGPALKKYCVECLLPENNKFGVNKMSYDKVVEYAMENLTFYWKRVANAIEGDGNPDMPLIPNWDLDEGFTKEPTLWVV